MHQDKKLPRSDAALSSFALGKDRMTASIHPVERNGRPIAAYVCAGILVFLATNGVIPAANPSGNVDSAAGIAYQILFLLVMLLLIATRFHAVVQLTRQTWIALLLPLLAALSGAWSQAPAASLRRGVFLLIVTVFANYIVARWDTAALLDIVLLAGFAAGALNIASAVFVPSVGRDLLNGGAWQGICGAKNNCAAYMLFLISPLLACPRLWRPLPIWKAVSLLMTAVLIVKADSKMAFMIGALWIPLVFTARLIRRFRPQDAMLLRILTTCLSGVALLVLLAIIPSLLHLLGKDANFGARTPIWHAVLQAVHLRPWLGFGYEAFWDVANGQVAITTRYIGFHISNAQAGFLDILLQLGLVGLLCSLIFFAKAFRDLYRAKWPDGEDGQDWTLLILMLILVYELDESLLLHPYSLPWFLTLVAFTMLHLRARAPVPQAARMLSFNAPYELQMTSAFTPGHGQTACLENSGLP